MCCSHFPLDLIDRLLIIRTKPPAKSEIQSVIKIRADTENLKVNDEGLSFLAKIGEETSLRHAIQLLSPAHILATSLNPTDPVVTPDTIKDVSHLFMDGKSSAKRLQQQSGFISQ